MKNESIRTILMFVLGLSLYFFTFYMIFEPSFILKVLELPYCTGYLLLISHLILLVIFSCWLVYE